jgi:PAS domain-containing protein
LFHFRLREIVVPIPEIQHGIVEPFPLVLWSRFEDAATQDVGEQLVSGLLKGRGGGDFTGLTLFGHSHVLLVELGVTEGQSNEGAVRRQTQPPQALFPPPVVLSLDMNDQVYGPERARQLLSLLRALAQRIQALDGEGRLLEAAPELQRLLGNARSELFHYEVRSTYDTPEVAESRRIVEEAERLLHNLDLDDPDDDEPWRRAPEG